MKYLLVFFALILSACSSTQVTTAPVVLPVVQAPQIKALNLSNLQWNVLNIDDIKTLLLQAQKNGNTITLYTLDNDNFTILDSNLLELERYINQQKQVILFYQQLENNKVNIPTKGSEKN